MSETQPYYIYKMQECLSKRQKGNPSYSLRAYARDLGMHPSTLCQVIREQRPLPLKNSHHVVQKLELSNQEKTLFLESLYRTKTGLDTIKIDEKDERFMLDESYYKIIAEWEHYAVLTLFDLDDFLCSTEEVALRLGITLNRARVVLKNLVDSNLLTLEKENYVRTHKELRTTEDVTSLALQESHRETMDMGKQKIDEIEVMLRDFSAMTIAMDLSKLTEAKTIIREFHLKMAGLLRDGNKTDVYQLAIQFYPLTKLKTEQYLKNEQEKNV